MTATAATPSTGGPAGASPAWRRALVQGGFEARMILRNGEQLLITLVLPVVLLVVLTRTEVVELPGDNRIDVVAPGILALAVMSTAFTSQAIATGFDRRNGVLRLLATTPLGRAGLLAGKVLGVLAVELVQLVVLCAVAAVLGWRPGLGGVPAAAAALVLGTAAFTAMALLLAGVLRAEAVLGVANLLWVLLLVGGGVVIPADQMPQALTHVALLLPSGALGEAMRSAFIDGVLPPWSVVVLACWATAFGWAASRLFRWH